MDHAVLPRPAYVVLVAATVYSVLRLLLRLLKQSAVSPYFGLRSFWRKRVALLRWVKCAWQTGLTESCPGFLPISASCRTTLKTYFIHVKMDLGFLSF